MHGHTTDFSNFKKILDQFVVGNQLPRSFLGLANQWFLPLAQKIVAQRPRLIGINGAQGTGKSTLAELLQLLLEGMSMRCVVLSIDDVYHTRSDREALAKNIHPLLHVRGVPGTHDLGLCMHTIDALLAATENTVVHIPRFNKANDDRYPTIAWDHSVGPVDLVILEGWCVGSVSQTDAELSTSVNDLESERDSALIWRRYVNQQLATDYSTLFARLDQLIMLKAPSMVCVEEWRWLQEQKLWSSSNGVGKGLMSRQDVAKFIQYYERITLHNLAELSCRADLVYHLECDHTISHSTGHMAVDFATNEA